MGGQDSGGVELRDSASAESEGGVPEKVEEAERRPISRKVAAATGGTGASTLLATVLVWVLGQMNVTMPVEVAMSAGGLLVIACTFFAGFLVRES